jgi:chromosome segregation ATPase
MPESAKHIDTAEARDLAEAVFEQSKIVEDLVRDSEERFAELTRRLSAVEHSHPPTAALSIQGASRDSVAANAINELRAKTTEISGSVGVLRTELNKWESEINERFLTLEKSISRSTALAVDARLLDLERKLKAMDTSIDGVEEMMHDFSGKIETTLARTASFDKFAGELHEVSREADRKMQVAVSGITDVDQRFSQLDARLCSVEARVQKIVKIAIHMGPHVIE